MSGGRGGGRGGGGANGANGVPSIDPLELFRILRDEAGIRLTRNGWTWLEAHAKQSTVGKTGAGRTGRTGRAVGRVVGRAGKMRRAGGISDDDLIDVRAFLDSLY